MKGFADTSFLLSLALQDEHLAEARRWWKRVNLPLHTSSLVQFEAENALRNMLRRGLLDEKTHAAAVLCLDRMIRDGSIMPIHFQTRFIVAEARRLITHFAPDFPHGTLDVLHVAAARLLKSTTLASFDKNQRALAKAAGLKISP